MSQICDLRPLVPNSLHFAAGDFTAAAVVELGGARIGVAGHVLGHLDAPPFTANRSVRRRD